MNIKTRLYKKSNIYIYITVLLIFGVIAGGCIEDIQIPDKTSTYHESKKLPNFELKINGADDYSRQKILIALNNTDKNAVRYISSINVVRNIEDSGCSDDNTTGCTVGNFTIDGKLKEVKIYILDRNLYKGLCNTFERTLYHEIGHVVYFYMYGNQDIQRKDDIYIESLELYAERYADKYYKVQKEGCDKETVERLKYDLEHKEKIYQYSAKVLSKWDKYKDLGIPRHMYDEYMYDYGLYSNARKEYMDAMEDFKNYMKRSQE